MVTGESTAANGKPALVPCLTGELEGALAVRAEKAPISGIRYVRNPEELTPGRVRNPAHPAMNSLL
ncbi:hypothetical protein AB0B30_08175 [Streptomyces narbonensis]|uniref:Uncharacterized protein n=1 Tax=Streptomyces narbonensis TaxID=67333 RepID=A0ABV3C7H5_9ACTN